MEIQGSLNNIQQSAAPKKEVARKQVPVEEKVSPPEISVKSAPKPNNHHPHLKVDENNGQVIAQILDDNGVVVKQIPMEELRQAAYRSEQVRSQLFDETI